MPTPSEQTRNAEGGARKEKPRSVFGNFVAPDGRATLSSARREETLEIQDGSANLRRGEDTTALPLPLRGAEPLQQCIDIAVARSFLHRFIAKLFEYPRAETWAWLSESQSVQAVSLAAAALNVNSSAENLLRAIRSSSFESFLD